MPNSIVKSFAKKTKLSVAKVESLWMRAAKIAEKKGKEKDYEYITGILKKSLKMEALIESAQEFVDVLSEAKEYELFMGRFQPLHKGHATVVGRMKNPIVALVKGGKSSQNKEKNPLSLKDQARLIKKAYPKAIVIEVATGYIPTIALEMRKKGMNITAIWAGEDRRASYTKQLESFDKKNPDEALNMEFKPTYNPDGARIGGTSATIVRNAIRAGDKKEFLKHMPKKLHGEWDFLRKKIK